MAREGASPAETGEGELDVTAFGRAIWRRLRWIVVPTLAAAFLSFAAVNLITSL
jgi:hypothetical protein